MSENAITVADRERYARARAAGERQARDPSAVIAVRSLRRRDAIELTFNSGGTMTIPRGVIPEFGEVPTDSLKRLTVSVAGDAIACRAHDIDIHIPGLVEAVFGSRLLSAAFARRGGQRRSKAKTAAARANGAKGGRPRNRPARRERP